ncbi:MAG: hypothetical protein HY321_06845, partial [Armatimonadetes bacterium]|nr:hypothetical protein [Armatimonadota bacterium]
VAGWSRAGWSPSPEGLAREIGASTSCLLLCGGFACLVAARFPARPARWRIGIAAILPLAMLVLPVLLSLHSAFAPDAQAVLSRIAPLAVLDPVTYLFDWPLSFEVRWIGQPPAWQASLGLQLLAACGLLLAAFRRPSARKG